MNSKFQIGLSYIQNVDLANKDETVQTLIRPIVTYVAETWHINHLTNRILGYLKER